MSAYDIVNDTRRNVVGQFPINLRSHIKVIGCTRLLTMAFVKLYVCLCQCTMTFSFNKK